VTDLAYDDVFSRAGRRYIIGKWASDALQERNAPLR
jgi:hypothetical protein